MDSKDVAHIHNGILFSHKKEILLLATTWMDLKGFMLNEISQVEKDKYHMILLICRILKQNTTK